MRIDLSLRQLEAFVTVAVYGGFRRAAAALGLAQPVVSRLIGQAEQTLGTRLFDRDTRRVEITAAGRELLPVAQRILRDFDSALSELGEFMQGRSGRVTVAALPSVGAALVPAAVVALRCTHPAVEFTLIEAPAEALLAAVEEGRADLGLSVRPALHQRLRYQQLLDDPMVLLCRADDPLARARRCRGRCLRSGPSSPARRPAASGPSPTRCSCKNAWRCARRWNTPA
jgi:DNA-binding transcriptional LysR family regulator